MKFLENREKRSPVGKSKFYQEKKNIEWENSGERKNSHLSDTKIYDNPIYT